MKAPVVPILLGVVAASLIIAIDPFEAPPTEPAPEPGTPEAHVENAQAWDAFEWVFTEPARGNSTLLALWKADRDMPNDLPSDLPCSTAQAGNASHRVRLVQLAPKLCDPADPAADHALDATPSTCPCLLQDNYTVANLTLYVFDDAAGLLATNDARNNSARLGVPSIRFDREPWFLGEGPAPNGTRTVPSNIRPLLRDYLPLLEGLPVGAIQSTQVTSHPYHGLVGDLWVTARVDDISTPPQYGT